MVQRDTGLRAKKYLPSSSTKYGCSRKSKNTKERKLVNQSIVFTQGNSEHLQINEVESKGDDVGVEKCESIFL